MAVNQESHHYVVGYTLHSTIFQSSYTSNQGIHTLSIFPTSLFLKRPVPWPLKSDCHKTTLQCSSNLPQQTTQNAYIYKDSRFRLLSVNMVGPTTANQSWAALSASPSIAWLGAWVKGDRWKTQPNLADQQVHTYVPAPAQHSGPIQSGAQSPSPHENGSTMCQPLVHAHMLHTKSHLFVPHSNLAIPTD